MKCEKARELVPDCLAGSLNDGLRAELESHLAECAVCREEQRSLQGLWNKLSLLPELEPSPAADRRFHTMLEGYRAALDQADAMGAARSRLIEWITSWWPRQPAWQFAGLVLLVGCGVLAGWGLRPAGSGKASGDSAVLAQLRQEILGLKEQMALALLEQQSVSERLRGVEWTRRLEKPDDQVLGALLRALESDPNVNVRLAAVEALQPFARQAPVRSALLEALPRQQSPLVQIELIHLMVESGGKELAPVLRSLVENQEINESVRERAKWGLAQIG